MASDYTLLQVDGKKVDVGESQSETTTIGYQFLPGIEAIDHIDDSRRSGHFRCDCLSPLYVGRGSAECLLSGSGATAAGQKYRAALQWHGEARKRQPLLDKTGP